MSEHPRPVNQQMNHWSKKAWQWQNEGKSQFVNPERPTGTALNAIDSRRFSPLTDRWIDAWSICPLINILPYQIEPKPARELPLSLHDKGCRTGVLQGSSHYNCNCGNVKILRHGENFTGFLCNSTPRNLCTQPDSDARCTLEGLWVLGLQKEGRGQYTHWPPGALPDIPRE